MPREVAQCLNINDQKHDSRDFCFPLQIPENDPDLPPGCLNFVRAKGVMDNSGVLLKTDDNLLPTQAGINNCLNPVKPKKCQVTDTYYNLSLNYHLIKNCTLLTRIGKDKTVFQEARKIVIAVFQHITYNDFLPLIIGQASMARFGLFSRDVNEGVFSDCYDADINPQVLDAVNVAAHRFGHSQVTNYQNLVDDNYNTVAIRVDDVFESPQLVQQKNGTNIPLIARNLACTASNRIDK
ncbi:PXDN [Mytilus edulis]|uniref:PXDN n=1 Tax=Mytilus edulis TaxID=6550 RepID=A0A8S3S7J5_MYTED|nr:PXDN [Mytilus edulis]